jgi:catechol 2,3-dioxygenase-like lactoylglutathione lyase family enzyme
MTVLLNIDVPDVETATTFYTAAFGLTVGRRFGSDFVELLGWPAPVYLLTDPSGKTGA